MSDNKINKSPWYDVVSNGVSTGVTIGRLSTKMLSIQNMLLRKMLNSCFGRDADDSGKRSMTYSERCKKLTDVVVQG